MPAGVCERWLPMLCQILRSTTISCSIHHCSTVPHKDDSRIWHKSGPLRLLRLHQSPRKVFAVNRKAPERPLRLVPFSLSPLKLLKLRSRFLLYSAIATAVTGLAPVCCCAALRQSCLVVSLIVSLGIHIVGGVGVARSLDRTTYHQGTSHTPHPKT